jgi:amino acid permease
MTWFGISVTYVRFYAGRKAQGITRADLPYSHALQPFAGWYAAIGTLLVCFVSVLSFGGIQHRLTLCIVLGIPVLA